MKKFFLIALLLALSTHYPSHTELNADAADFNGKSIALAVKVGHASWYSEQDPGINKYTANNEVFDDGQLTAAMWEVPFNQRVRVTNVENGKSVIVRINDRGPHKRFVQRGRIIDLSKKAFSDIAPLRKGLIPIRLELL